MAWVAAEPTFTLVTNDIAHDDYEGQSVSATDDGLKMVVGAPFALTNPVDVLYDGIVYTYDWNGTTWVEDVSARLLSEDTGTGNEFGMAVSISGDGLVLAVGAPGNNEAFSKAGRIYIYDWSGTDWTARNEIDGTPSLVQFRTVDFGSSVSLSTDGEILSAGCFWSDDRVFTYDRNLATWDLRQVLSTDSPGNPLGYGMAMSRDATLLVSNSSNNVLHVYKDVSGAWVKTANLTLPTDVETLGSIAITPDKTKIVFLADFNGDLGEYSPMVLEFDGDTWSYDEGQARKSFPALNDAWWVHQLMHWITDTQLLLVSPYNLWPDSQPASYYRGYLYTLDYIGDTATSDVTITGCVRRSSTSGGVLEPIKPPTNMASFPEFEGFFSVPRGKYWVDSVGAGISVSNDGLTMVLGDDYNHWVWVIKRSSVYTSDWAVETILNRAWSPFGYWDADPEVYAFEAHFGDMVNDYVGGIRISGDGNTIVSSLVSLSPPTGTDAEDYPNLYSRGVTRGGGVGTFKRDPDTGEWVNKWFIQLDETFDWVGPCDVSDDGLVMWGAAWIFAPFGTGAVVFDWDESLDNWVQRVPIKVWAETALSPSWMTCSEAHYGACSGDGSTMAWRVYEGEGYTQFPIVVAEWNGSAIVQKGDVIQSPEWGKYAHSINIDMNFDGTTIYLHLVIVTNTDAYVVAYDWSGSAWVSRSTPLVGPFYTYAAGAQPMGLAVMPDESAVFLQEFLEDIPRNNELWGIYDARFYDPPGFVNPPDYDMTDEYITIYGPQLGDPCFTKVECPDDAVQVVVGEYCVDWADPPPTPPDDNPNLPKPPGGGFENNDPNVTCTAYDDYKVVSNLDQNIGVNSNPNYTQYLIDQLDQQFDLDPSNGAC